MKFPNLQNGLRNVLSAEREKVVREEKFIKEEPDRLESALRRCKKLTGTLVTLKRQDTRSLSVFLRSIKRTSIANTWIIVFALCRLASVQEQRLPCAEPTSGDESGGPRSADSQTANKV